MTRQTLGMLDLREIVQKMTTGPKAISQNAVARLVGADPGNFGKILRGNALPGLALANRMKALLKIRTERWDAEIPKRGRAA